MSENEKMNIFTSANFFIHQLDINRIIIRTFDVKKDQDWLVNIGNNYVLWFDDKEAIINFADRILSSVKSTEIEEKVKSETNT